MKLLSGKVLTVLLAAYNGSRLCAGDTIDGEVQSRQLEDYDCEDGCDLGRGPPVCGADGNTYFNECLAICQDVEVSRPGACPGDPPIPDNHPLYVRSGKVPKAKMDFFKAEGFKFKAKRIKVEVPLDEDAMVDDDEGRPGNRPDHVGRPDNGETALKIKATRIDQEGYEFVADMVPGTGDPTVDQEKVFPSFEGDDGGHLRRRLDVFGDDTREQVDSTAWPYKYIGQLVGSGSCTATVVSKTSIATNGHCVYDRDQNTWKTLRYFSPRRNGVEHPYGQWEIDYSTTFTTYAYDGDRNYDFAIVTLKPLDGRLIGSRVGYAGYAWTPSASQLSNAAITGYPGDKGRGEMWTSGKCADGGPWEDLDTYEVRHYCDTSAAGTGGTSGSALMDGSYVRGVHYGGTRTDNRGLRLYGYLWDALRNWSGRAQE